MAIEHSDGTATRWRRCRPIDAEERGISTASRRIDGEALSADPLIDAESNPFFFFFLGVGGDWGSPPGGRCLPCANCLLKRLKMAVSMNRPLDAETRWVNKH